MSEQLGPIRDQMAFDCMAIAEGIAEDRSHDPKPFYIIYSAKVDPALAGADAWGKHVAGGIRQAYRLSYDRPPFVLGMLVWYVNAPLGIFQFVPELSSPPDIPIDPSLLSTRSEDFSYALAGKAKEMNKVMPLVS
jgi:hypothetical protein